MKTEKMVYERLDAESEWPKALLDLFWAVDALLVDVPRHDIAELLKAYDAAEKWRKRL